MMRSLFLEAPACPGMESPGDSEDHSEGLIMKVPVFS